MNKINLFVIGIIIFYLGLYVVPSLKFFPIPFAIFFLFAFKYLNDFKKAIFLAAVISLPYSWGKSLLVIGEEYFFVITPFIASVLALSVVSLRNRTHGLFSKIEIFLILFFLWGIFSFVLINTYPTVIDGVFKLSLSIAFYFLSKTYLQDTQLKKSVTFTLISILIFESILVAIQFLIGHPLGILIEEGLRLFPFGRLASEDTTLFRPSGTMTEPTWMARFLTMLLPFILIKVKTIFPISSKVRFGIIAISLFAIFATFTRVSWAVTILLLIIVYFGKKPKNNFRDFLRPIYLLFSFVLIISGVYLYPYFIQRWQVTPISFEEGRSFDLRIKLIQEAVNLIQQYPFWGVGLNRFVSLMQENTTVTYLQNYNAPVHNVFLIIASEMGIPALIFFVLFIFFSYKHYFRNRKFIKVESGLNLKDAAALGGLAYLLEAQMGTIFLSPHLSLFMLYMAIINSSK